MEENNKPSITAGVARTSVLIAGGRTLATNSFIKEQLKISEKLDESLIPYYENVYKKEPWSSNVVNDKIATYDPYAYFFCCTKESTEILLDIAETYLNMIPIQYVRNHIMKTIAARKGLDCKTVEELKKHLIDNCTPIQSLSIIFMDSMELRLGVRNKFIDDFILNNMKDPSILQYVILGAGLDTRALRMPFAEGSTVWEVDFPQTFQFKEMVLNEAVKVIPPISKAKLHRVTSNVLETKQWISSLEETGFDRTKKTVWILEGLVNYLPKEDVAVLCQAISSVSASGSSMVIQSIGNQGFFRKIFSTMVPSPLQDEYKSTTDTPCDYIKDCGFTDKVENNTENDLCSRYDYRLLHSFFSMDTDSIIATGYKP
ncbi:hypothetical protein PPL_04303 [Heterostelium album PN500]|uniref:Leucine carboxyl methyltransferase n=1 Tax=Heterostelium pallidum (strain ATCC 26659 / Pp 5 / PN500) TaxID=670386 RepID=D3B768_HETP5|nr:hypothetical protein PPL_04303 [Heterostelium album PN500]EFA82611.1 hypothetical protein PPL_04303 [Heterostelium album PN500]|eukprot:XP_020434728.1 hypothetical protein PPL_04303 [Heterostelium album PN500]